MIDDDMIFIVLEVITAWQIKICFDKQVKYVSLDIIWMARYNTTDMKPILDTYTLDNAKCVYYYNTNFEILHIWIIYIKIMQHYIFRLWQTVNVLLTGGGAKLCNKFLSKW